MISNSRITKLTSIILTILLLSAIAAPVSASATILTHKEKRDLDIPNYVLPIKNFDMKPYMVKKTLADITFLKFCFRDDTCWNSLDAETQSYIYKGIPKTIDDIIFNSTDKKRDDMCNRHHNLCNLDKKGWVGTESPTCAGTVITVGTLSPSCYFSIGLTSTVIVSLVSGINSHHQNEMLVNKYTDQLKLFNDINIKYDL